MQQGELVRGAGVDGGVLEQLLVVDVAGHRCALPVADVVEIHPAVRLATLPDAPPVVVGLVNRRGAVVPVLGLRQRLGLPARALHPDDRLVVVQLPDRATALLVDAVVDVVPVDHDALDQAVTEAAQAAYTRGAVVLPDGLLVVVDLPAFLSSAEAAALDRALAQAGAAPDVRPAKPGSAPAPGRSAGAAPDVRPARPGSAPAPGRSAGGTA